MARVLEHREALRLRKEGKSYSQIKAELGISKSTLSDWLRKFPLTKERIRLLRDVSEKRIERCRNTKQKKRGERLLSYYQEEKTKWFPFSERELFIAGLFLYWGEGNKADRNVVGVSNTDPSVIKFAIIWITKCLHVSKESARVQLHLYSDMEIDKEIDYWAKELGLSKSQFTKPYIKETKRASLDQKGLFGHGTCNIKICKTEIKERILMDLRVVSDLYSQI